MQQSAQRTTVSPQYKLPISVNRCAEILTRCYSDIVTARGATSFENDYSSRYIASMARWLSYEVTTTRRGLFLYGGTGCGKSTLVQASKIMVDYLKEANYKYLLSNRWRLSKAEQAQYDRWRGVFDITEFSAIDIVTDEENYSRALHAPVLFIDDFGVEQVAIKEFGTQRTPIIDLIYARYRSLKPTIFTSNLSCSLIVSRYGERVYDRLVEWCDFLSYSDKNFRKRV